MHILPETANWDLQLPSLVATWEVILQSGTDGVCTMAILSQDFLPTRTVALKRLQSSRKDLSIIPIHTEPPEDTEMAMFSG